ncbi:MAG TPA: WG repeat-containing protein [Ignavibacteria bacterium]|nr:WG repeat-containing protein [Ignavibacteria bacterium]HMQ99357.1 WG repeat-containing protein [Ignavibacteria bacterium]
MRTITNLLFSLFIFSNLIFAQDSYKPLFKIYENGLYGYIDSTGAVVIPPKFKGAGEFSEGLAPVRENGYYGYIDVTGKYVLPAVYDYAESFKEGLAKIYIDGNANIIDKTGKLKINFITTEIKNYTGSLVKVRSSENNWGVVKLNGNIIIDTIYNQISDMSEGIYIVNNYNGPFAAINSNGNMIVPFGVYYDISEFHNGFSVVNWNSENPGENSRSSSGIIDLKGRLIFSRVNAPGFLIHSPVSEDSVFIVKEYYYTSYKKNIISLDSMKYSGIMDFNGNLTAKKPDDFKLQYMNGKIYYRDSTDRYFQINKEGKLTGNIVFRDDWNKISSYKFARKGKDSGKYGIIDSTLKFILEPSFDFYQMMNKNFQFIFGSYINDTYGETDRFKYTLGISDLNGNIILRPEYDQIDYKGFFHGLVLVRKSGKTMYINKEMKVVWEKKIPETDKAQSLDIDYQLMTWFTDGKYNSGWIPLYNTNIDDLQEDLSYIDNNISLLLTKDKTLFNNKNKGNTLYLINDCDWHISVPGVDNALYMVLQAKDKFGNWKNIEAFPSSTCGNSYNDTKIRYKSIRKYSVPEYSGELKTKIRAMLKIYDENKKIKYIYSNEIEGKVNPAQFWRNPGLFNLQSLLER